MGFAVVLGFLLLLAWGGVSWARKGPPGRWWWRLLGALQGVLLLQVAVGLALLALGSRRPVLHYLYGAVFPFLVLLGARAFARDMQDRRDAGKVFTVASFFLLGLTLRALMTGLGQP